MKISQARIAAWAKDSPNDSRQVAMVDICFPWSGGANFAPARNIRDHALMLPNRQSDSIPDHPAFPARMAPGIIVLPSCPFAQMNEKLRQGQKLLAFFACHLSVRRDEPLFATPIGNDRYAGKRPFLSQFFMRLLIQCSLPITFSPCRFTHFSLPCHLLGVYSLAPLDFLRPQYFAKPWLHRVRVYIAHREWNKYQQSYLST